MSEKNQIVTMDLSREARIKLYGKITAAMEERGMNPVDYRELECGIDLAPQWPMNPEPTLAELVVVARKLGLRIVINGIDLEPMPSKLKPWAEQAVADAERRYMAVVKAAANRRRVIAQERYKQEHGL